VVGLMSRVSALDATGAAALGEAVASLQAKGVTVLLSGIRQEHQRVLAALGVTDGPVGPTRAEMTFPDAAAAIAHAETLVPARTLMPVQPVQPVQPVEPVLSPRPTTEVAT
nr:sodium-independent anion transporter [Micromonospora sp. DSM 115978]